MRHLKDGNKLGRLGSHRRAMFRNMMASLVLAERIETTIDKAKIAKRFADRIVTLGKKGTLHARRRAISLIRNERAVQKLFSDLAKRFQDRNGGYTRVYRLGRRFGDGAQMAILEYLGAPVKVAAPRRKKTEEAQKKKHERKNREEKKMMGAKAEQSEMRKVEQERAEEKVAKKGFLSRLGLRGFRKTSSSTGASRKGK